MCDCAGSVPFPSQFLFPAALPATGPVPVFFFPFFPPAPVAIPAEATLPSPTMTLPFFPKTGCSSLS
jgi:hypothetical protein